MLLKMDLSKKVRLFQFILGLIMAETFKIDNVWDDEFLHALLSALCVPGVADLRPGLLSAQANTTVPTA